MAPAELERLRADLNAGIEAMKAENSRQMDIWRDSATRNIEGWKADQMRVLEGSKASTALAQQALKSVLLINAGGAAALLAFMGSQSPLLKAVLPHLVDASIAFGFGILAAVLSTAVAFAANEETYMPSGGMITGDDYRRVSWLLGLGAAGLFITGCLIAVSGFRAAS